MNNLSKEFVDAIVKGNTVATFSLVCTGRDNVGKIAATCESLAEARALHKTTKMKTVIVKLTSKAVK